MTDEFQNVEMRFAAMLILAHAAVRNGAELPLDNYLIGHLRLSADRIVAAAMPGAVTNEVTNA